MPDSRYALLIANGQYAHMPTLQGPARDVAALERVLRDPAIGGFAEVTTLVDDASPDSAREAITRFFSGKKPDDLLVVYFSGHGVVDNNDGSLHLAAKDTDPRLPYARSLEAAFITNAMNPKRCRAKRIVLIFDCCYSGAFDAGWKSGVTLDLAQFKSADSGQGRVVLTASTAVQPACDAQGEIVESFFTHFLVEGLETGQAAPDKEWVSVDAAYQYAHSQVKDKQTPEISVYHQQGEILLTRNPRYVPSSPPPLSLNHHFICYAPRDGADHAARLHTALGQAGARPWLDQRDTPADYDPEAAREDALRECASVLLVLTPASASVHSESAREWRRALQFKKPIVPVRFAPGVDLPLMLGNRAVLDFTGPFDKALADLRRHLADLPTPAGQLRELEYRLADAEHELRQTPGDPRIVRDIAQLETELTALRAVARDPQAAARAAEKRTEAALERERQPERPTAGRAQSKFINPPPLVAPSYFQDRHAENRLIADFLRDPACRLLTVSGRGGVGKTAMVCHLLKTLEAGHLPDDLGELPVSGIVYLSATGSHRVSFPNLHADLLRLLPADRAQPLATLYQDPKKSVADKLTPVWEAFAEVAQTPVVVLLDNLEDLLDPATHTFTDAEVDAALRALLNAPPHPVKVLLTTRAAPREILLVCPERQMTVPLDEGLASPYAEAILRAGDPTGVLGLKEALDERLAPAREYTRGYPRALEALTAALNADRATSLDDLLAGPPPANVVEALVGQAYSRLDTSAQKVMQALAVFGRPVPPAAVDYLLQPYLPGLDSTPVLNRLVNMRFVTKEAGRYYMHPVDRAYALQRLTLEPAISNLQSPISNLQSLISKLAPPTISAPPARPAPRGRPWPTSPRNWPRLTCATPRAITIPPQKC